MKKVLFVDTVHPMLWEELEKEGFHCIEAYDLSKEEVKAIMNWNTISWKITNG